jgi:hypothetical protein
MIEERAMVYLYWLGAFIVFTPLILGLPLISLNRIYRTATLFAGMNAGIVTLSLFINLLRWGAGPAHVDQLHRYFTHALPSLYIASLVIGSTIVPRYYLSTTTRVGALLAILGCLSGTYILSIITAIGLEILSITIQVGYPSFETLSGTMDRLLFVLIYPDLSFVILFFVPVFISLNGTAAAMRISDESEAAKDEEPQ